MIQDHVDQNILTFLLTMVCSPTYFNNPYLGNMTAFRMSK